MRQKDVRFLNPCGVGRGYDKGDIAMRDQLATVAPKKSDSCQPEICCGLKRLQNVDRITGGRDAEKAIAPMPQRADLSRKHLIESVVVADAGERGTIGGQCDRSNGRALGAQPAGQFGCDMLAIGGRSAVAAKQQFTAIAQT